MRRFITTLVLALLVWGVACARRDKPIRAEELPEVAREFIGRYFANSSISFAQMDTDMLRREYEVMLSDGSKLEFAGSGEWRKVECSRGSVPEVIIPQRIRDYLRRNYSAERVVEISRDRRSYEVSLSNRLELTFDREFNLIGIDD